VPPRQVRREIDIVGVDLGLKNAGVIHDGVSSRAWSSPRRRCGAT
jgi:hypothetical protein